MARVGAPQRMQSAERGRRNERILRPFFDILGADGGGNLFWGLDSHCPTLPDRMGGMKSDLPRWETMQAGAPGRRADNTTAVRRRWRPRNGNLSDQIRPNPSVQFFSKPNRGEIFIRDGKGRGEPNESSRGSPGWSDQIQPWRFYSISINALKSRMIRFRHGMGRIATLFRVPTGHTRCYGPFILPIDGFEKRRIKEMADVILECGPIGAGKFAELRQPLFYPCPLFSPAFCNSLSSSHWWAKAR